MTIEIVKKLVEKAKCKKDGVYSFKGYMWVVKNKKFIAYSDSAGFCYMSFGVFITYIGKVDRCDRKKELAKLLINKN